jgi:filamentous hemagglutinin
MGAAAAVMIGGNSQAAQQGATIAITADQFNRQLHPGDRQAAKELAAKSGGKYTEAQILEALQRSGLTDKNGNVIVEPDSTTVYLNGTPVNGAQTGTNQTLTQTLLENLKAGQITPFNVAVQGSMAVELLPTPQDKDLTIFIQANTGGASSPYTFNPNTTLPSSTTGITNSATIPQGACATAECAAGLLPAKPDNRTQAQIDKSLSNTTTAIALLPLAVAGTVIAPEATLIAVGVNGVGQIVKGEGLNPTETVVSAITGPLAPALAGTRLAVTAAGQSTTAAVATTATIGATNNVVTDSTTKVLTGEAVTIKSVGVAVGAGAAGNVVTKNPLLQPSITELGNRLEDLFNRVFKKDTK